VAISNERIVGIDGNEVLLRVRADGKSGKRRTLRVAGTEFMTAFYKTSCRAASSASAITACLPLRTSARTWPPHARHSAHRHRSPW
jgi:hypothetical protein